MSDFLWYSFGSDASGPKLAKALGFMCGKKTPPFADFGVVLGWGCKPGTKYDPQALTKLIEKRSVRILNHPDQINSNRNKLTSLKRMRDAGVRVPGFVNVYGRSRQHAGETICKAIEDGILDFPILGLEHHHKGGVEFCYTAEDVVRAITEVGDRYFRSFCPGTEYRLHTFRDRVIDAEVKVLADDPLTACATSLRRKLERKAKAQKVQLAASPEEIRWVIEALSGDLLTGPSHIQRSVNHGWSYQPFPVVDVTGPMAHAAIAALDALQLDLGAVSIVLDGDLCTVTGVTSAPTLTDERVKIYASEIKEFCKAASGAGERTKVAKQKGGTEEKAPRELIATLRKRLGGLSRRKAEKVLKSLEG